MPNPDQIRLLTAIDENQNSVRTRSLDLSFNELLDMYKSKELRINPEYQRLFRWSEGKQSRFVESLILEMPIPPIFVIEEENGKYELIDGLQRISSYLHFRGSLQAPHMEIKEGDKLRLSDCDIIKGLNDLTIDELPEAMVIRLKRSFIRVEVIRKESDRKLRYHMFKRLNTGGETLSEQEIRNCTIRLLDEKFNTFLMELSRFEPFKVCIEYISDLQRLQLFDQELVLRFFSFKNLVSEYQHDVGDFMTDYMERVTDGSLPFDYIAEAAAFQKTFAFLNSTWGELSFGWKGKGAQPVARFSVYHFEAFTLGIQTLIDRISLDDASQIERLKQEILAIKTNEEFVDMTTGGGKNSRPALERRIQFVQQRLTNKL